MALQIAYCDDAFVILFSFVIILLSRESALEQKPIFPPNKIVINKREIIFFFNVISFLVLILAYTICKFYYN